MVEDEYLAGISRRISSTSAEEGEALCSPAEVEAPLPTGHQELEPSPTTPDNWPTPQGPTIGDLVKSGGIWYELLKARWAQIETPAEVHMLVVRNAKQLIVSWDEEHDSVVVCAPFEYLREFQTPLSLWSFVQHWAIDQAAAYTYATGRTGIPAHLVNRGEELKAQAKFIADRDQALNSLTIEDLEL